ncbi:hypothetical protein JG687_00005536 [Phytophthora cactorum]|uniref:Nickel insertion protein n=1 Tax=Phytophthora cactorum TaxID=29920 RepID=A0A8T1UKS5_9STRA|nr:hypothetical protein JG687_00005536 [Phytophthora cactorum]
MSGPTIAFIDCSAGIAGDMLLGALIDAGAPLDEIKRGLESLHGIKGEWELTTNRVWKGPGSIAGTKANVGSIYQHKEAGAPTPKSGLSDWAKEKSVAVFTLLAQAEAHTHGTSLEEIHFHEVGAIDSIVDTIGSVIALDLLGVREVHASFLPFSSGTVKCMHGVLPVPPPATFRLMIGVPVCPAPKGAKGELVTPTGISLVKALASTFGEPPAFIPTHTGVGAGTRDFPEHANIVRVAIGTKIDPMATEKSYVNPAVALRSAESTSCPFTTEKVVVLETNLDDLNPQVIGYVSERLLSEHHALDVWKQPIQMKKNRPGVCLSVLYRAEHEREILETIFRETSTLGVRRNAMDRVFLSRKFVSVSAFGRSVDVKVAFLSNEAVNVHPEFEHCKAIAVEQNIPLIQVIDEVKALALPQIKML